MLVLQRKSIFDAYSIIQQYSNSFCVDFHDGKNTYANGSLGSRNSNESERLPCLYDNSEKIEGVEVVIINHFDLNILGGVLAVYGVKPGSLEFWEATTRYYPVHGEKPENVPADIPDIIIDQIRAFQSLLSSDLFRMTHPSITTDIGDAFDYGRRQLTEIFNMTDGNVHNLAEERIQQMEREWKTLNGIVGKSFTGR